MTKATKARQAEAGRKSVKQAVQNSFGKKTAEAAVPAKAPTKKLADRAYGVFVDSQGVAYLKVENTSKGGRFVINTGKRVDVVELDEATIRTRALEIAPEAFVSEAAKILAKPVVDGIIISDRAQQYLNTILSDETLIKENIMKTKSKKSAGAKKATASAKSGKTGSTRSAESMVKFHKAVKDGELPKQAAIIVGLVQSAKTLTIAELQKKMAGKIESKQSMQSLWGFYRKQLIDKGYISVVAVPTAAAA